MVSLFAVARDHFTEASEEPRLHALLKRLPIPRLSDEG